MVRINHSKEFPFNPEAIECLRKLKRDDEEVKAQTGNYKRLGVQLVGLEINDQESSLDLVAQIMDNFEITTLYEN